MKIVIGLLAAAILGTGGFAFAAGADDTQPARTVSLPGTTTAATACGNDRRHRDRERAGHDDDRRRHLGPLRRG
jgi:hypothetical protein